MVPRCCTAHVPAGAAGLGVAGEVRALAAAAGLAGRAGSARAVAPVAAAVARAVRCALALAGRITRRRRPLTGHAGGPVLPARRRAGARPADTVRAKWRRIAAAVAVLHTAAGPILTLPGVLIAEAAVN